MDFNEKIQILMRVVNKGDLDKFGWHLVQLTREEAISLYGSQMEKDMTDAQVVNIQLFQIRTCCERFLESLGRVGKFPASLLILLSHDLCVNAHLNLPNDEKYNFTSQECLEWANSRLNG